MAEDKPVTPEKQLLNLIEKPIVKGSLHAATIRYHGLSLFSLGALKARLAFLGNRLKVSFKAKDLTEFNIKALNQILEIGVFCLIFYFVINLLFSVINLGKDLNIKIQIDQSAQANSSQVSSFLKTMSYYLEKARERDIFKMGVKSVEAVTAKGPSAKLLEVTQNLKLVGISWSNDPDVMIEDTKNQRTLFLKKGQVIEDDLKLKAVFKDKVILSLGQEEVELR
jgi:hypothetical protein